MRSLVPSGLLRVFDWKRRFKAIGLDTTSALRAALSEQARHALVASRIEHLPLAFRSHLALVVDVGANRGQWISAIRRFVKIERIEAFEPNHQVVEELKNCLDDHPCFYIHQTALGARTGQAHLNVTRGSDLSSLLVPSEGLRKNYATGTSEVIRQITVPVATLDAVLPPGTVDLLKIDVQGFERPVLLGGTETLKRTRALIIEMNFISHYEGDDTFDSLCRYLTKEVGFKFWDLSPPHRAADGRALWTDAVFVNPAIAAS